MMITNSGCRICRSRRLHRFVSLGPMPLANAFLGEEQLSAVEPMFPLDVYLCSDCSLVQSIDVVDPSLMFKNYVYFSSTSDSFVTHFRSFAQDVFERFELSSRSLVVDIGSNDGILLRPFHQLGLRILGIDPAENVARQATENGIETLPIFFNLETAQMVQATKGKADVITANNVFAHVNNLDDFVRGVKILLQDHGVFIFEVPYLADLLQKNLFDTIYHEHLSYFSVKPLVVQFQKHEMRIFDIQRVASHGGSLRVFVKNQTAPYPEAESIETLLQMEKDLNLYDLQTWRAFAERIQENKRKLRALISELKSQGKKIAGYGAPAKGNTLLNYFEIGRGDLDYIGDDSKFKQGLFTPGTHIPVVSPLFLEKDKPDCILILAWNFAGPIMKKLSAFHESGGKFIIPVPSPEIV